MEKNTLSKKTRPTKLADRELADRQFTFAELPETGELGIQKQAAGQQLTETIRNSNKPSDLYKLPPEEFKAAQNAIQVAEHEDREMRVYANSIESKIGYDALIRLLGNYFGRQMAYFRSEAGGSLSPEEARKRAYASSHYEASAEASLNQLLAEPVDNIRFEELMMLHRHSPRIAENLWEMIKREAQSEFESGHRAAEAFEPADYMTDAWNRASYLGVRESLCAEWNPKGGIELSMIDAIAQAWLQLQFWTKESVKRAQTKLRVEHPGFQEWKRWSKEAHPKRWSDGDWDLKTVREQTAVEHAAQMADRWQRMYFRAIRSLRDWRRYTPITINHPNQVNIANDGGQQINVSKAEENGTGRQLQNE